MGPLQLYQTNKVPAEAPIHRAGNSAVEDAPMDDRGVTVEDVRCARALLEIVGDPSPVEQALREEAIRIARDLLGPVAVQDRGALRLISAGRERLRRRGLRV